MVAPYGTTVDPALVPANVQRAIAEHLQRSQSFDLTDFLNRQFSGVSISHAQNNPLQPDFNFRGFTASPILGLPQGLAVYQNGVRINDPFGDTVNWDLIAMSAIDSVQLLAGAQPVFGLNTLGGALSLQMKNGFTYQGSQAELYDGSFGRLAASAQAGGNDGRWGLYGNASYFEEEGWRDFSKSQALRLYGAVGLHESDWAVDLSAAYANTELRGNGDSPVELLALERSAVFTHPDITENEHTQLILEGSRRISNALQISGDTFIGNFRPALSTAMARYSRNAPSRTANSWSRKGSKTSTAMASVRRTMTTTSGRSATSMANRFPLSWTMTSSMR